MTDEARKAERAAVVLWLDKRADELVAREAEAAGEVKPLFVAMAGAVRAAATSIQYCDHLPSKQEKNDGG